MFVKQICFITCLFLNYSSKNVNSISHFPLKDYCRFSDGCLRTVQRPYEKTRDVNLQNVLGGTSRIESEMKSYAESPIRSARELRCYDWSDKCKWRNEIGSQKQPKIDELEWVRASGRPDAIRLNTIVGTIEVPGQTDGKFLITGTPKLKKYNDAAMLVSDQIPCQLDDGLVRFKYWTSPLTEIRVCKRRPNAGKSFDYCSPVVTNGDPGPTIAVIPGPINEPFEIVIMSSGFTYNQGGINGGLVIIDDLDFDATICDNTGFINPFITHVQPLAPFGQQQASPADDVQACLKVSCNFNSGRCIDNFLQKGWKTTTGAVGNAHTGVRTSYKGSYIYGSGSPTDLALRSGPFELSAPRRLTFCYYRASVDAQLVIGSLSAGFPQTLYSSPVLNNNQDPHKWVCDETSVPPGKTQGLQFDIRNLRNQFAYFGLDEIQLMDENVPLCNL